MTGDPRSSRDARRSFPPRAGTALVRALAAVAALDACAPRPRHVRPAPPGERAAYLARRGALAAAETTRVAARGRYAEFAVRLRSTSGLAAGGRLLVPTAGAPPYAAVLLNDGRELNSRAVEALPPDFGDVVVLSLDYPAEIPYHIDLGAIVRHGGRLRELAREIPPTFSLGGAYLARRADVDPARVALVATSFAVPFAGIAAALDTTFRNVALVYGAGEMDRVLAANLALRPAWLRGAAARVAMRPFAEFEPARFVGDIAPRPVVMVNGADDPQIPAPAVRALYDALRPPKEQIWLRTGHLMPDDTLLIRALVDTALARLPVLRTPERGRRPASVGPRRTPDERGKANLLLGRPCLAVRHSDHGMGIRDREPRVPTRARLEESGPCQIRHPRSPRWPSGR